MDRAEGIYNRLLKMSKDSFGMTPKGKQKEYLREFVNTLTKTFSETYTFATAETSHEFIHEFGFIPIVTLVDVSGTSYISAIDDEKVIINGVSGTTIQIIAI